MSNELIPTADFEVVSPMQVSSTGDIQLMHPDQMTPVLQQFDASRGAFIKWLLSHFIEGRHYGFPPGCEAEYNPQGELMVRSWDKIKKAYVKNPYPKTSWQPKPMLYKTGVDLGAELFKFRPEFEYDETAWKMLGSVPGHLIVRCKLYRGDVMVGSGIGAAQAPAGDRLNLNKEIKQAHTRAKRDALLNAAPILAALFDNESSDSDNKGKSAAAAANEAEAESRPTPAGRQQKQKLLIEVTDWLKKTTDALDPTVFVQAVVNDLLRKTQIDTMAELDTVQRSYKEYDPLTGERIGGFNLEPE